MPYCKSDEPLKSLLSLFVDPSTLCSQWGGDPALASMHYFVRSDFHYARAGGPITGSVKLWELCLLGHRL